LRTVIGCLSSKYVHASLAPWCLNAGVREFCAQAHSVFVLESTINSDLDDFFEQIREKEPEAVCFSCYIWNVKSTLALCKKIKKELGCFVIIGGPEVEYRADCVLENEPYVDFVLSGEGEFNLPKLLDALSLKKDLGSVDGLTFRQNGQIKTNPTLAYKQDPPSPYCDEFFEKLGGRICYIESSRGCPYRCAFCLSGRLAPMRFFDLERTKNDILKLANSGSQTIKFVDRTFNANAKRCNEILLFIKENYGQRIPGGMCFHFEIAGDILTEETLDILSKMPVGSVQLEIGMQSFNEQTLLDIHRKTDTRKLVENIQKLISFSNMHIHIDLIAGLKGEDFESFKNSFNIGYALKSNMLQLGFLKLLYGADMRENADEFPCTFNSEPPYEVTETPWLSSYEIKLLKRCEDALDRLYNSGRFLFSLEYLTEEAGLNPFELFCDFGAKVCGDKMRLSDYALSFYEHFKNKCDGEILREKIVCDLICSGNFLQIPERLRISSPMHKQIRLLLEKPDQNLKIVLLPKSQMVFVVDANDKKRLNGRLPYTYYQLSEIPDKIN